MSVNVFCLILNYNKPGDTAKCLSSIYASKLQRNFTAVIIDNGPDNLRDHFHALFPLAVYIQSPGNIGFAAGNNQGIRYALEHKATHILIINPDVVVPRDFLGPLLKDFGSKVGLVAPAHTEGHGVYGLGGRVEWHNCSFPHDNVTTLPSKAREYELLTFACVLIKREVFEKVGYMDERYFLYLEDVDYCVSAARKGYKLLLDPRVVVTHKTSSSFDDPRGKIKFSYRSSFIFIAKWLRFPRNIIPLLHTITFYPYLYTLWTLKIWKRKLSSH